VNEAIFPISGLENWKMICLIAEKMGYPMAYGHP
jgi:hypothetical protein